jgi:hypothetical protein
MGFVWHERNTDAGIDGEIELRNPVTGEVANRFILIQSKASNRRFSGENDRSFHFICEPTDVTYWMGAEEPVLLVCSHPEAGQAWWMHVQGWFSDPAHRASGRIDFDKSTQRCPPGRRPAGKARSAQSRAAAIFSGGSVLRVAGLNARANRANSAFEASSTWAVASPTAVATGDGGPPAWDGSAFGVGWSGSTPRMRHQRRPSRTMPFASSSAVAWASRHTWRSCPSLPSPIAPATA